MSVILNPNSDAYKRVLKAEETLVELGIEIISQSKFYIKVNGKEYNIGRDSNQFPRFIEEHFWREK